MTQTIPPFKPVQRILCPVDFSETTDGTFAYAAKLAHHLKAELLAVYAYDNSELFNQPGHSHPELQAKLDALKPPCEHVQVTRLLQPGPPGEVICWLAQERSCDLIVMGTHGRTGLKHLFLGSVAEYVMRHARCPVLTLRERSTSEPPLEKPQVLPVPAPRFM